MHLNWFNVPHDENRDQSYLHLLKNFLKKDLSNLKEKKYFCSFVASQPKGRRVEFVPLLHQTKSVHCGGRLYNNIGGLINGRGDQKDKITFLNKFKFNISFENCSSKGYITEKIIQPMFTNTIPIYWGAEDVIEDFNENSFINANSFKSNEQLIDYILEVDNNKNLYDEIIHEPWFNDNKIPEKAMPKNILKHIKNNILK